MLLPEQDVKMDGTCLPDYWEIEYIASKATRTRLAGESSKGRRTDGKVMAESSESHLQMQTAPQSL
jgi:hypothetical protein